MMVMTGLADWLEEHMLPCLNKKIFGIDCPGCGMQRGVVALLRGDFGEAWEVYAPIFPIILTLIWLPIALKWNFKYRLLILKSLFMVSVGFIIVNYIIKMS